MGDRANIVVRDHWPTDLGEKEAVFIYSHWGGYEMPETLRAALVRGRNRWDDGPYLGRIIAEEVIGDGLGGETGVGISTRLGDNEYDLLVLLLAEDRIVVVPERHYAEHGLTKLDGLASIGFADYVVADERTWDNLTDLVDEDS